MAKEGVAVTAVYQELYETLSKPNGAQIILKNLLGIEQPPSSSLTEFLHFRSGTITQFITEAAALIHAEEPLDSIVSPPPSLL